VLCDLFLYFLFRFLITDINNFFSPYFYDTQIIESLSSFVQFSSSRDESIKLSLYFQVARCVAKNEWSNFFWSPLSLDARISHNGESFSFSTHKNCYFLIYLIFVAHEEKFMLFLCVFVSSKNAGWFFFLRDTFNIFYAERFLSCKRRHFLRLQIAVINIRNHDYHFIKSGIC
jgi:hypothetical protein